MPTESHAIPTQNKQAYTLIELLISISIGALLLSGIAGFITSGLQASKGVTTSINAGQTNSTEQTIFEKLQTTGIQGIEETASGILIYSEFQNLLVSTTGSLSECGEQTQYLEVQNIIKTHGHEQTASGIYSLASDRLTVLSGATNIFGTGIRGGRIVEGEPLNSELGGASSLELSGTGLYITDPNNHRIILINTDDTTKFSIIDSLDYGIQYPTSFTKSGSTYELIGENQVALLEDMSTGSFTGELTQSIGNSQLLPIAAKIVEIQFPGSTITNISPDSSNFSVTCNNLIPTCTDSGDTISKIGNNTLRYSFSGAGIVLGAGESITTTLHGIGIVYTAGSGSEYYGNISLFDSGSTLLQTNEFHYSTVGDGDPLSGTGNINKIASTGKLLRKSSNPGSGQRYNSGALMLYPANRDLIPKIGSSWVSKQSIKNLSITLSDDKKRYILEYYKYPKCDKESIVRQEMKYYLPIK